MRSTSERRDRDGDAAAMWCVAVLVHVDALPGAEVAAAVGDRYCESDRRERGAHVAGHVVGALVVVLNKWVAVGDEAGEKTLEVAVDLGVGVLGDQQRRAGVVDEQVAQARLHPAGAYGGLDLGGDVDEAATRGGDLDGAACHRWCLAFHSLYGMP